MSDVFKTQMLNVDPNRTQLGIAPTLDPNKTMMGTAPSLNATQTIKPTQCPVCKTFNPAGVMFCVDCGLIFDRALPGDAFGAPAIQLPQLVEQNGREHPIRPGTVSVGREGDLLLSDGRASRRHAQLINTDGVVAIEDLGSTNGTKVNGQKLIPGERRNLNAGDKVSFGGIEMQFAVPGQQSGNATQVFGNNKTAAIAAPPQKEVAPARLVGDEFDFPLRAGINTFGRKSDNDVQIPDGYVSGKHGTIEIAEDGVYIVDTGSSNGTMLNDARLVPNMRTQVQPDDVIQLGSRKLKIVLAPKK